MVSLIRWMTPQDEVWVRGLHRRCHPDAPPRPDHFYQCHPTLVIPLAPSVIGFTCFTLSPPTKGYVAYGVDVCVDAEHRGKGYGRALHAERSRIAKSLGAIDFVGLTTPDNEPMARIFAACGIELRERLPDGQAVYIGSL